jgi:OOP family OmpA-OmpF porin
MKQFCKFHKFWLILTMAAFAQEQFANRIYLGLKLGLNFPSMSYSNEDLDNYYSSSDYKKGMFELFGEYAISPSLSVRPGLKYTTRGQYIDESKFTYEFNAQYTEFTLPIVYTFPAISNIHPYLLGGPVLGFALGGDIRYDQYNGMYYETKINNGNLKQYAFGLYLGAGIKYPMSIKEFPVTLGFEAGYHLGLSNTYSDDELDGTANALNAYSYNISGDRKHRGFEAGIIFSIPLGKYKEDKLPEPEPVPVPEPEKLCYTIDEIKELIHLKESIHGKKICAIKQVSFKFGSSELTDEDKVYLDEMVILMETNELISIRINGHTDNVGGEEFNMNLSHERAKAIHDYIKSKGIDGSRLSYAFYGSTRPIADNDTEEGRAINRRVEFEFINQ